jgi:hypothetical protein
MTTVAPRADVGMGSHEGIAEATVIGFFNAYRAHDGNHQVIQLPGNVPDQ